MNSFHSQIKYNDQLLKIFNNLSKLYYHDALIFRSKKDPIIYKSLFEYLHEKNIVFVHHTLNGFEYIKK
jgi:hypothetical protein